jgi:hypothetical protein
MMTRGLPQLSPSEKGLGTVPFDTPSDVNACKTNLALRLGTADSVVRNCASIDDVTRAGWNTFVAQAQTFAKSDTSSSINILGLSQEIDTCNSLLAALDQWIVRFNSQGCQVPLVNPEKPEAPLTTALKIGAAVGGVALALGAGYAAYKIYHAFR